MKMIRGKEAGVTLIELLVSVAFGLVLLTAGVGYYFTVKQQQGLILKKNILTQQMRISMRIFNNMVKNTGVLYCEALELRAEETTLNLLPFAYGINPNERKGYFYFSGTVSERKPIFNRQLHAPLSKPFMLMGQYSPPSTATEVGDGEASDLSKRRCATKSDFGTAYHIPIIESNNIAILNHLHHLSQSSALKPNFFIAPKNIHLKYEEDEAFRSAEWDDTYYIREDGYSNLESGSPLNPDGGPSYIHKRAPHLVRAFSVTARAVDPEEDLKEMKFHMIGKLNNPMILYEHRTRSNSGYSTQFMDYKPKEEARR